MATLYSRSRSHRRSLSISDVRETDVEQAGPGEAGVTANNPRRPGWPACQGLESSAHGAKRPDEPSQWLSRSFFQQSAKANCLGAIIGRAELGDRQNRFSRRSPGPTKSSRRSRWHLSCSDLPLIRCLHSRMPGRAAPEHS